MRFLILGILVLVVTLDCFSATSNPCPDGWTFYFKAKKCYKHFPIGKLTFAEAQALCQSQGGDLATATNLGESNFISFVFTDTFIWLGGKRIEIPTATITTALFEWTYRGKRVSDTSKFEPAELIPWQPGQPSNGTGEDCLIVFGRTGKWYDNRCTSSVYDAVCEINLLLNSETKCCH